MWSLFSFKAKSQKQELKNFLLKEHFNSSSQKKTIMRAAEASAKDQQNFLVRYQEMLKAEKISAQ